MSKLVKKLRGSLTTLSNYAHEHGTALIVLGVLALAGAGIWIVIKVPPSLVHPPFDDAHVKQLELEDAFRKTITQIIFSLFGLLILYFTWRRAHIMEQGHITDRFTKAIEQLGKTEGTTPNIEIRLGAIYALERIAIDSPRDHWSIMEILTAYVRQHAPLDPYRPYMRGEKPSIDIQAILTVLGRRRTGPGREDRSDQQYLDLMRTRLCGAKLTNANLQGTDLEEANLQATSLWGAHLQGAALIKTTLQQANLREADLEGAYFSREAQLGHAKLDDVELGEAHYVTTQQIQSARNWRLAHYSPAFRAELGLPSEHAEDSTPTRSNPDQPTA